MVASPGSVTPHRRFEAHSCTLPAGRRGTATPFFSNYRPQFYFRTTDVVGGIDLGDVTMVMPGDAVHLTVELAIWSPWMSASASPSRGRSHRGRRHRDRTAR